MFNEVLTDGQVYFEDENKLEYLHWSIWVNYIINWIGQCNSTFKIIRCLNVEEALPKINIYSLNSNDNAAIGTLIVCFQGNNIKGKILFGSS